MERWVQVALEACVDLAYHTAAERGWTPPDTARGALASLAAHGVISAELANRRGLAVGMRDILVHEYAELDLEIVASAVRDGLSALREFGAEIGALLSDQDSA